MSAPPGIMCEAEGTEGGPMASAQHKNKGAVVVAAGATPIEVA